MVSFLSVDDLLLFVPGIDQDKAQQMIDDATALAVLAAPCLGDGAVPLTSDQEAAVRAVLRQAIVRWDEAGSGVLASQTAGPFAQALDTRQQRRGMFFPSEIASLQSICAGGSSGRAFGIDTTVAGAVVTHLDTCDRNFGGNHCTCGAWLSLGTAWFPS